MKSFISENKHFKKDISKFKGTIANVLLTNHNNVVSCKSMPELKTLIEKLFINNQIDTPKSRQINIKLSQMRNLTSGLMYIENIILKGSGLGL